MEEVWYYVEAGERKGPVELALISEMIESSSLGEDDYVWKKGFKSWTKIKEIPEFNKPEVEEKIEEVLEITSMSLEELTSTENKIFIKIGADRGGQDVEYGPYSLDIIKQLYKQNRISSKTLAFVRGMSDWNFLSEFTDFSEIFEEMPPPIEDVDRRKNNRKPFIARMYIESNKKVYVGVCRDISVGGMQVLVDQIPSDKGEKISINVHPENTEHHFVAGGEIVRLLDGGQGFSFRFTELNEDAKDAIQNYLNEG
jgi:hypothetical protein